MTDASSVPPALSRWRVLAELASVVAAGTPCVGAHALWGSSRALVIAALREAASRPVLVVTPGQVEAHQMALDIAFFLSSLAAARNAVAAGHRAVGVRPGAP